MNDEGFWVFGYGSLVWEPGFPFAAREVARLEGFHRSFCMHSIHHRGTSEDPGLVLALDRAAGAHCTGVAYRVGAADAAATLAGLRERELVSSAYLEERHEVGLQSGRRIDALCYIVDRDHVQYCGGVPLEEQAQIIAKAHGGRGPNCEYLYNTARHLRELGLGDGDLDWLETRVRELVVP